MYSLEAPFYLANFVIALATDSERLSFELSACLYVSLVILWLLLLEVFGSTLICSLVVFFSMAAHFFDESAKPATEYAGTSFDASTTTQLEDVQTTGLVAQSGCQPSYASAPNDAASDVTAVDEASSRDTETLLSWLQDFALVDGAIIRKREANGRLIASMRKELRTLKRSKDELTEAYKQHIISLWIAVAFRNQELGRLGNVITQERSLVTEKDIQISQKCKRIENQAAVIRDHNTQIQEQNVHIKELGAEIISKDTELDELKAELAQYKPSATEVTFLAWLSEFESADTLFDPIFGPDENELPSDRTLKSANYHVNNKLKLYNAKVDELEEAEIEASDLRSELEKVKKELARKDKANERQQKILENYKKMNAAKKEEIVALKDEISDLKTNAKGDLSHLTWKARKEAWKQERVEESPQSKFMRAMKACVSYLEDCQVEGIAHIYVKDGKPYELTHRGAMHLMLQHIMDQDQANMATLLHSNWQHNLSQICRFFDTSGGAFPDSLTPFDQEHFSPGFSKYLKTTQWKDFLMDKAPANINRPDGPEFWPTKAEQMTWAHTLPTLRLPDAAPGSPASDSDWHNQYHGFLADLRSKWWKTPSPGVWVNETYPGVWCIRDVSDNGFCHFKVFEWNKHRRVFWCGDYHIGIFLDENGNTKIQQGNLDDMVGIETKKSLFDRVGGPCWEDMVARCKAVSKKAPNWRGTDHDKTEFIYEGLHWRAFF
jgi:hypothetical protein